MEKKYTSLIQENLPDSEISFFTHAMQILLQMYNKLLPEVVLVDIYTSPSFHTCTLISDENFLSFEVRKDYLIAKINNYYYLINNTIPRDTLSILFDALFTGKYQIKTNTDHRQNIGSIELQWLDDTLHQYNTEEQIAIQKKEYKYSNLKKGIQYIQQN
ncbi:MAG: hypothetical protein LBI72_08570 [Flavobacteriaceae bacterium]|jgi:hypothetical protein|nr:hypothetical protein [Flavobacteriaceae bacterium]